MASNKKRLQGLIGGDAAPAATAPLQRGAPYQISTQVPPAEPSLPPQASALSPALQEIARRYIGARRRSGEALLEAARWIAEARAQAQHGEWSVFLEATATTEDTAERLMNIHMQAMQNPHFAEAISRNWLSQSAAALLARPSTPPEVMAEVLGGDQPPSVAQVTRKLRGARKAATTGGAGQIPQIADFAESYTPAQIPQIADFAESYIPAQIPQIADFAKSGSDTAPSSGAATRARTATALDVLREVADTLSELVGLTDEIARGAEAEQALARIEQALTAIRSALH